MNKQSLFKCWITFILLSISTTIFSNSIILNTGETIKGRIYNIDNKYLYLDEDKKLIIVPLSMIKKILNEQDLQLEITKLEKRSFSKINYNSFSEIRIIDESKRERRVYSPHYLSNKYGTYYDHRVNKMIYGNTARIMEKGITSFSSYDILLLNFCGALSNKFEADIYFISFMRSSLFMANIKYSLYSSEICHLALKSGFKKSSSIGQSEENRTYYSGFPQSILFTFGNVDKFITGSITIEPASQEDNAGKKEFTPVSYHLGSSVRIFKNMSISFEIFNSWPLSEKDWFKDFDRFSTVTGMRFFWRKNSFDLGLMDTFEQSDRYYPIFTYTHHF